MFSVDQVFVIGFVSSVLVYLINFGVKKGLDVSIGRGWLTVMLFVISIPLAWLFDPQVLPGWPTWGADISVNAGRIVDYIGEMVGILAQVVGAATAIYNLILKKVADGLAGRG